jgi:CRP-like cAMP-binding protein
VIVAKKQSAQAKRRANNLWSAGSKKRGHRKKKVEKKKKKRKIELHGDYIEHEFTDVNLHQGDTVVQTYEVPMCTLNAPALCGEEEALSMQLRIYNCRAVVPSRLYAMKRASFNELLRLLPANMANVREVLAGKQLNRASLLQDRKHRFELDIRTRLKRSSRSVNDHESGKIDVMFRKMANSHMQSKRTHSARTKSLAQPKQTTRERQRDRTQSALPQQQQQATAHMRPRSARLRHTHTTTRAFSRSLLTHRQLAVRARPSANDAAPHTTAKVLERGNTPSTSRRGSAAASSKAPNAFLFQPPEDGFFSFSHRASESSVSRPRSGSARAASLKQAVTVSRPVLQGSNKDMSTQRVRPKSAVPSSRETKKKRKPVPTTTTTIQEKAVVVQEEKGMKRKSSERAKKKKVAFTTTPPETAAAVHVPSVPDSPADATENDVVIYEDANNDGEDSEDYTEAGLADAAARERISRKADVAYRVPCKQQEEASTARPAPEQTVLAAKDNTEILKNVSTMSGGESDAGDDSTERMIRAANVARDRPSLSPKQQNNTLGLNVNVSCGASKGHQGVIKARPVSAAARIHHRTAFGTRSAREPVGFEKGMQMPAKVVANGARGDFTSYARVESGIQDVEECVKRVNDEHVLHEERLKQQLYTRRPLSTTGRNASNTLVYTAVRQLDIPSERYVLGKLSDSDEVARRAITAHRYEEQQHQKKRRPLSAMASTRVGKPRSLSSSSHGSTEQRFQMRRKHKLEEKRHKMGSTGKAKPHLQRGMRFWWLAAAEGPELQSQPVLDTMKERVRKGGSEYDPNHFRYSLTSSGSHKYLDRPMSASGAHKYLRRKEVEKADVTASLKSALNMLPMRDPVLSLQLRMQQIATPKGFFPARTTPTNPCHPRNPTFSPYDPAHASKFNWARSSPLDGRVHMEKGAARPAMRGWNLRTKDVQMEKDATSSDQIVSQCLYDLGKFQGGL